jgi:hypothetical protein
MPLLSSWTDKGEAGNFFLRGGWGRGSQKRKKLQRTETNISLVSCAILVCADQVYQGKKSIKQRKRKVCKKKK